MYLVNGTTALEISSEPIRLAYYSAARDGIYASTYDDELVVLKLVDGNWEKQPVFAGFSEYISAFLEDDDGSLWVCGNSAVYKMNLDENGSFHGMKEFEIPNPYHDEVRAVKWKKRFYFLMTSAAYYFDGSDKLKQDTTLLNDDGASRILYNSHDVSWLHDGTDWLMLSDKTQTHISTNLKLNYLKWLGDLSGIFIGQDRTLWAVTKHNELFRIDLKDDRSIKKGYQVYLKDVKNQLGHYLEIRGFDIDRKDNQSLHFSFYIPSYFANDNARFQYMLKGEDKTWSDWERSNSVSYVGLASGKYELLVRAKDAFGNISEMKPISFRVIPPYWEQPWFYGSEILFFSMLLVLSYRLNRRKLRYKVLSQVLTIFTLILIVEFVQVSLESLVNIEKTPVTNFCHSSRYSLMCFSHLSEYYLISLDKSMLEKRKMLRQILLLKLIQKLIK